MERQRPLHLFLRRHRRKRTSVSSGCDGRARRTSHERRSAPRGFTVSARWETMAYVGQDSSHPDELFAAAVDGSAEKRLTSFNDSFVKDIEPIAADRILYKSKDG